MNPQDRLFSRTKTTRVFKRSDLDHLIYAFLIILLGLVLMASGRLEKFETGLLDTFFSHRPSAAVHPAIAVIEIGEDSLQAIGPWPWPARYHAEMIHILTRAQAGAIVFETPIKEEAGPEAEGDELGEALRESARVYLPVQLETRPAKKIWVHSLPIDLEAGGEKKFWLKPRAEYALRLQGTGFVQEFPDTDGIVRSLKVRQAWGSEAYPYLGIQAAADFLKGGRAADPWSFLPQKTESLLINWTGKRQIFPHYSYADIVRSYQGNERGAKPALSSDAFKNKICLIGLTAGESARFYATPVQSHLAGVEVLAQAVNTVLTRRFINPLSLRQNAFLYLLLGIFTAVLFLDFHNLKSLFSALGLCAAWLAAGAGLLWLTGLWIDVLQPVLLVLVLFIFSALYAQLVAVHEQSRLFDLATRDGLTGLYVIRYFREVLNQVVDEALAAREPLSLILMDIDNFKTINDTLGHPAGDYVLKKTAQIIQSVIRLKRPAKETDLVARYGGEEFVVMVRRSRLEEAAAHVAERIRTAVEKTRFEWEGKGIAVTLSAGVAALRPQENVPDFMVRRADEALYQAKRSGKNKVCQKP